MSGFAMLVETFTMIRGEHHESLSNQTAVLEIIPKLAQDLVYIAELCVLAQTTSTFRRRQFIGRVQVV
jgi:hypothetical protein